MNLINELLQLCIEKNSTTEHDLFFELAGHINSIYVSYYLGGFSAEKSAERLKFILLDDNEALQEAINEIKELV